MELIKKYWYVTVVLLGTAALGVSTLLVSLRIQQRSAVIREDSRAATPECTLTFTIQNPTPTTTPGICELSFALTVPTNVPTNTPTNTPTNIPSNTPTSTPTNTPTGTATPGPSPTPTNTPSSTPTNIPTNTPGPTATPGPTSTPTYTPSVTATLRPTNTPAPGACNYACKTNSDCGNSLVCSNGFCRNPQCTEQPNCACYFVPTPKVPVTGMGTTLLGVGVIAGGVVLLLLGFIL